MWTRHDANDDNRDTSGLEIATNTVAFATYFFPFATKISGEVANLRLIFPLLFRNKKVTTHKNCGLIFCFAKPPTGKCSTKSSAKILRALTLRLKVARLRLNFGILSQNCDWYFSLISSPVHDKKTRDSLSLQELHFVQRHPSYPRDNNELTVKNYETKYCTITFRTTTMV